MGKPNAVVFDLDGTLAICNPQRGFYDYDKVETDLVYEPVLAIMKLCTETIIILLTGREEWSRAFTTSWLKENNITYDKLLMRTTNDHRPGAVVKEEIYLRDIKPNYNVQLALDDQTKIITMWEANNIPALKIVQ